MHGAVLRALWLGGALGLLGCGGPSAPRPRAPVVVVRSRAPSAVVAPTLDERLARARRELDGELDGSELVAQRIEPLDGEARIHLVLEHGLCYRVWVGADGPIEARLEDEHGHPLAAREGEPAWLDEVCPRWSGSFALVVVAPRAAPTSMAVLVAARAR